jgi:hypothetical protein
MYKLPGIVQIPLELIQAGRQTLHSEIHKLIILFEIRKNCISGGRSLFLYLFARRVINVTIIIIQADHCHKLCRKH